MSINGHHLSRRPDKHLDLNKASSLRFSHALYTTKTRQSTNFISKFGVSRQLVWVREWSVRLMEPWVAASVCITHGRHMIIYHCFYWARRGPLEACVKTVFSFSPLTLSLLFLSSLSFILLKDCQIRKCRNDRPVVALLLFVSAMTACRPGSVGRWVSCLQIRKPD